MIDTYSDNYLDRTDLLTETHMLYTRPLSESHEKHCWPMSRIYEHYGQLSQSAYRCQFLEYICNTPYFSDTSAAIALNGSRGMVKHLRNQYTAAGVICRISREELAEVPAGYSSKQYYTWCGPKVKSQQIREI